MRAISVAAYGFVSALGPSEYVLTVIPARCARRAAVSAASVSPGSAVGQEEHHLASVGTRLAACARESRELGDGEPHAGREVGATVGTTSEDGGQSRPGRRKVRGERHLQPGVLLVVPLAIAGVRVHLAGERDDPDAHAPPLLEIRDQRIGGRDLGGQDRVPRIGGDRTLGIGARRQELELRIHPDLPVPIHVHAAGHLGGAGDVEDDDHVELGRRLPLRDRVSPDGCLVDLVAHRLAGSRCLDEDPHG